ncbi:MAG TPA: single-stranded DNA-binding protein, partial [Chloroflexota bacterium]|nr:single-stranded DNA-binding protein [Chloroflexota bacterium]
MAGSLNKVMLIGRVGTDPEMRYTPSGMATTSFRLATSHRRNTPEGWKDETDWHSIVTWDKLAERMGQS